MKPLTFDDLQFEPHPHPTGLRGEFKKRAFLEFSNGYGVSVITGGRGVYGDEEHPYEVAILKDGYLTYDTHITDDVIGYCTEERVTEIMRQAQEL